MKQKIIQKVKIPEGITCTLSDNVLNCKKESNELERNINIPLVKIEIKDNEIIFEAIKGNKVTYKKIMTNLSHVNNLFHGLIEGFTYELESCNVHFPMTIKVEGDKLSINNFFGEKTPRYAKILPNVNVEIKGQKITITSPNREAAGQTAANFEKATKVKSKDKRIYQDGIYITQKPRREND